MAKETIRVEGLKGLQKALKDIDKELLKELRAELVRAASVVREEAQRLFVPINPASASGYRVRVRARGVAVEQSKRRTTGLRPDYGVLQMQTALLPALQDKEELVVRSIDGMLGDLARKHGF